jgi:hypothetical protein
MRGPAVGSAVPVSGINKLQDIRIFFFGKKIGMQEFLAFVVPMESFTTSVSYFLLRIIRDSFPITAGKHVVKIEIQIFCIIQTYRYQSNTHRIAEMVSLITVFIHTLRSSGAPPINAFFICILSE